MADDTYIDTSGGSHINGNVDVKRDFAGRDINYNYFTGHYAKLAQLYRTPQHIFDDVDVQGFVGRENVKRAIDTFIDDNPRGAFIIEGEAGLGKTSLMAHLVYTRGYAHIFGQEFTGLDGRVEAARSLAAQLISQYQLEGYGDSIDIDQAASSTFLTNVLNRASGKLREGGPFGDKLVIVCDALYQAAPPANDQNVFGLPKRLPNGVYLIVTQRPVQVAFECEQFMLQAI